jgi:hypothetical protein
VLVLPNLLASYAPEFSEDEWRGVFGENWRAWNFAIVDHTDTEIARITKTWEGLVQCYVAAIPFFRNGVAGDLLFTALFFATPVLVKALQRPAYAGRPAG